MKPKPRPPSKSDRLKEASYAEGGKGNRNKMFPEQAANPQKPGLTSHAVKGDAPGAKRAVGGRSPPVGGTSERARPGRTGPRADD